MKTSEYRSILGKLEAKGFDPETVFDLRRAHPHLRFTVCQSDDMEDREPYARSNAFQIFLLASDGHCLGLAERIDHAVGLILAED